MLVIIMMFLIITLSQQPWDINSHMVFAILKSLFSLLLRLLLSLCKDLISSLPLQILHTPIPYSETSTLSPVKGIPLLTPSYPVILSQGVPHLLPPAPTFSSVCADSHWQSFGDYKYSYLSREQEQPC